MSNDSSSKRQKTVIGLLVALVLVLGFFALNRNSAVENLEEEKAILVSELEEYKRDLIGHKNAYVAQQRLDGATRQVVASAIPPAFEPLKIVDFDYSGGTLVLQLDRNVPSGWAQEFHQPRGGHSAIMGCGPETFRIQGRTVAINAREDESLIQSLINNSKNYVDAANRGYVLPQQEQAPRQERAEREEQERRIAEAQQRANILKNVKL